MKDFKSWLYSEQKNIFGFENKPKEKENFVGINPINTLNFELISQRLCKTTIGNKIPNERFIGEVCWGNNEAGSLRLNIGTDLHIELGRMGLDLEGEPVWATKRLFQLDRSGKGSLEESICQDILDELKAIDKTELDSPKEEYDLEKLAIETAYKLRRTALNIFVFEGIMKVDENDYIIRFSVSGQGVESPDHKRVVENQTRLIFRKNKGIIEAWNYNIETKVGGHDWKIQSNDLAIKFFPTQDKDEIAETLACYLRWY